MTYARFAGETPPAGASAGCASIAAASASTTHDGPARAGRSGAASASVRHDDRATPASASMKRRRSSGYDGSRGTYARARLEDAQDGGDGVRSLRSTSSPTRASGPTPRADEVVRDAVRARVQLPVRQAIVPVHQGHGVRGARGLFLEELVDAAAGGIRRVRAVPPVHDEGALRVVHQLQGGDAHAGIRHRLRQHARQVRGHPLHRRRVEQVAAVHHRPRDAAARIHHGQAQVELGRLLHARPRSSPPPRPPTDGSAPGSAALQGEGRLEERRVRQAALRLQLVHQLFEGHVLVRVRVQHRLADAAHERAERRIVRDSPCARGAC